MWQIPEAQATKMVHSEPANLQFPECNQFVSQRSPCLKLALILNTSKTYLLQHDAQILQLTMFHFKVQITEKQKYILSAPIFHYGSNVSMVLDSGF